MNSRFFLIFCLLLFPLILIHELGHALVARLLGFEVLSITVGNGPQMFETTIWRTKVTVRVFPLAGMTSFGPYGPYGNRVRYGLVALGGPATHIAFVLIYLLFFLLVPYNPPKPYLDVIHAFVFTNLWLLLVNLFPRKIKTLLGIVYSDGYEIYRLLVKRMKW